jgi:hypothetical protein
VVVLNLMSFSVGTCRTVFRKFLCKGHILYPGTRFK